MNKFGWGLFVWWAVLVISLALALAVGRAGAQVLWVLIQPYLLR